MAILSQNTFTIYRIARERFELELTSETLVIPANPAGVADLTLAETAVRVMKDGKEVFPSFDESLGGRNLVRNSDFSRGLDGIDYWGTGSFNDIISDSPYSKVLRTTRQGVKIPLANGGIKLDEYISLSAMMRSNKTTGVNVMLRVCYDDGTRLIFYSGIVALTDNWKRYDFITRSAYAQDEASPQSLFIYPSGVDTDILYITQIKLEKGDKPTNWTPAPGDILLNAVRTNYNCSSAIVNNTVKISTLTPGKKAGYTDIEVSYGEEYKAKKRLTWALAKEGEKGDPGDSGISITSVDVLFAKTSGQTAPDKYNAELWSTNAPAITGTQQLWTITKTTYTTGTFTISNPVNITPGKGDPGTGIESITEYYLLHTAKTLPSNLIPSGETPPGGWLTTPPAWEYGKYIFTCILIKYKNPTSYYWTVPLCSSEWEAVEDIEIGGVNLVKNGNFLAFLNNWQKNGNPTITPLATGSIPKGAITGVQITASGTSDGVYQLFKDSGGSSFIPLGRKYTISLLARATTAGRILRVGLEGNTLKEITLTTEWTPYKYTFTAVNAGHLVMYPQNAGTFQLTNIQLEEGTKNTAFRNGYLEEAIKGSTEINGGLLLGNVLGTKDEAGVIRAYMSGLESNKVAFAAGVNNFGLENETQSFAVQHDGSGHLANGNLWWNILGEMFLGKEYADKSIVVTPTGVIPSVTEITNKEKYQFPIVNQNVSKDFNNPADSGTVSDLFVDYIREFELKNDGILDISAGVQYLWGTGLPYFGATGNIVLQKWNGSAWIDIQTGTYYEETRSTSFEMYDVSLHVTAGRFRFNAYILCGGAYPDGPDASVYLNKYFSIKYQLKVKKLVIASDGIAFLDSLSDNYFRLSLQDSIPLRYSGGMDMPGVLASGSVGMYGVFNQLWGSKKHDTLQASRNSVGYYTVYHSVGHNDYTVQITPETAQRTCYVGTRQSSFFTVYFYNMSSALADANFNFQIVGKNWA